MSTLLTPEPTSPNRALPQLRSEVSRLTHRRLYRVLTLLLLGGIVVVSAVVFVNASKNPDAPPEAQAAYADAVKNWQRDFDLNKQNWQACVDNLSPTESAEFNCGPEPDVVRDAPRPEYFYSDPRYDATVNLPVVIVAVTMAGAALAFVLGASSGGAEWSSRSMTLQLLWEPRRFRLLSLKWLALGLVTAATTVVAMLLGVTLGAATAWLRGVADVADGAFDNGIYGELASAAGRGLILVVVAASFGYAIAMLVRNTGAALGTAFVYLLFVENAIRIALIRFGSEAYMLTTNAVASVVPGGLEVPGRQTQQQLVDGLSTETTLVQLGNGRALLTVLLYLVVIAVPAVLSFTRRDVG